MIKSEGIKPTCTDWRGVPRKPPLPDRKHIVAELGGVLVWSRSRGQNRVRYGLEVHNIGTSSVAAAEKFGECLHHLAECDGLLVNDSLLA